MAIGRFFGELIAEGVIFRWLAGIWGALKGGMGHPVVQEWAKTQLTPKGLNDESIFAFVLAKADMKKGGVDTPLGGENGTVKPNAKNTI